MKNLAGVNVAERLVDGGGKRGHSEAKIRKEDETGAGGGMTVRKAWLCLCLWCHTVMRGCVIAAKQGEKRTPAPPYM